ncbi:MAG: hypothetical protein M1812_003647 [Candelaria pacifica]|nr:MAG: hypothetical protein M1812_003647 [Candelaria pacifica]
MASLRPAAVALTGTQVAGRAVHIKVHPRPRNLDECREILRVLERYGEVVMFKNLRHEFQAPAPNTVLAIYQHASSASNLVAASPLRYGLQSRFAREELTRPYHQEDRGIVSSPEMKTATARTSESNDSSNDETSGRVETQGDRIYQGTHTSSEGPKDSSILNTPRQAPPARGADSSTAYTPSVLSEPFNGQLREFQLAAEISHFNHRAYIERQPHYGGFQPDTKSIVAEDLASSVPLVGLSDLCLRKAEVPLRVMSKRAQELAQRKTLREIWEEGMKEA